MIDELIKEVISQFVNFDYTILVPAYFLANIVRDGTSWYFDKKHEKFCDSIQVQMYEAARIGITITFPHCPFKHSVVRANDNAFAFRGEFLCL
ncbi:MAG: hypothetical protein ACK5NC_11540 [Vibrio sp.]